MTLVYGSVCSGIEAATVAWHPLRWQPAFFSEIDPFPRAVLAHHYPEVPLHGDFTTIQAGQYRPIDLLVGGTPCQSFSVAGLRGGLDDDRGNLALEYLRLAQRLGPRWLVWENVPGVLSSAEGRDFGSILGGLVELGYGFAYRVLDAQFIRVDGYARAVPQRRRRVFVVGYLGDWRRAAAVLFERQGLSWDPPPRRETRQGSATDVAPCLRAGGNETGGDRPPGTDVDTCESLIPVSSMSLDVAHSLRADGFDASEDGTGRGTPLVPIPFDTTQITNIYNRSNPQPGDPCHGLASAPHPPTIPFNSREDPDAREERTGPLGSSLPQSQAVCFGIDSDAIDRTGGDDAATAHERSGLGITEEHANALRAKRPGAVAHGWRVRRLTPIECERLQGFPDGYTDVPWRRRNHLPDGPRYKALGNSMAVNVMRWIGRRIEMVEGIR